MLKLFRILARGAAARAEGDLFDRHALLVLDQQVRETRASLERSRRALAATVAADRAEARRLEEIESRAADLETRAVAALAAGRDGLAREAAEAIAEIEREREAVGAARAAYAQELTCIREAVADASRRQADLERGRRVAAAAEAVRRMRTASDDGERATLAEAEATLARLRALQAEAADTEAALAESGRDIAERLEREGFGPRTRPSADAVMERLRSRVQAAA